MRAANTQRAGDAKGNMNEKHKGHSGNKGERAPRAFRSTGACRCIMQVVNTRTHSVIICCVSSFQNVVTPDEEGGKIKRWTFLLHRCKFWVEFFNKRSVRVRGRFKSDKEEWSVWRGTRGARRRNVCELVSHSSQRRGSRLRSAEINSDFGVKG